MKEMLGNWFFQPLTEKEANLWWAIPVCLLWVIRKERNKIVFEVVVFSLDRLKSFFSTLSLCLGMCSPGLDLSLAGCILHSFWFALRAVSFLVALVSIFASWPLLALYTSYIHLWWIHLVKFIAKKEMVLCLVSCSLHQSFSYSHYVGNIFLSFRLFTSTSYLATNFHRFWSSLSPY